MSGFLTEADLPRVAELLRSGEIVALPTETVYGLAADALNAAAVAKIFAAKGRPFNDPLIVHAASPAAVREIIGAPPPAFAALAARFWPGPLTLVLPKKTVVPDIVSAGLPTVAVRCPAHPFMRRVLEASGLFLAAPSANPFGYVSPTTAAHVRASLGERCPWVLDGGPCEHGVESTIVLLDATGGARLLRPGPVPWAAVAETIGLSASGAAMTLPADVSNGRTGKNADKCAGTRAGNETGGAVADDDVVPQLAPGMLSRHYSPRTLLVTHEFGMLNTDSVAASGSTAGAGGRVALVWQARAVEQGAADAAGRRFYGFSADGDQRTVARNIFALLRELDTAGFDVLHVELADPAGALAPAINDRLRRAAIKRRH